MAGIFKAYDIRGIYGQTLTKDIARDIGRAFVTYLKCETVVVGYDIRVHSLDLFDALTDGITMQGADVFNLGLCSTPVSNFANGFLQSDASIMITASHNPPEWNGFKMARKNAIPLSGSSGIDEIERIVMKKTFDPPVKRGRIIMADVLSEYISAIRKLVNFSTKIKVAADLANGMGVIESKVLENLFDMEKLYGELDGRFPNHEANPLKVETLVNLQELVKKGGVSFGIAFDGDADRIGFVDERGDIVPMDYIIALIASDMLRRENGVVLYDLRSSKAVPEYIREKGGVPVKCRVGHAFIKQQMREYNAIFAGEFSGHYYFRENYYTESSSAAAICIGNLVSQIGKPLSELVQPLRRYYASGEINSRVENPQAVIERLKNRYKDAKFEELDGLTVEYKDWWFNVRCSNTEPLVRLNLEAITKELMEEKREEVLKIIRA